MGKDKDWKEFLLRSGLPFEYEVKNCLVKHGCTVWDEFSYLKLDENKIEKEFSYDIDANFWYGGQSFDLLVECKYKTEPTTWFFIPDANYRQSELNPNSFLHPLDHFSTNNFLFDKAPYYNVLPQLGPFCLKGTEIYQGESFDKNIVKAVNQLSYAFVEKVRSAFVSQLEPGGMFNNTIMYNIPVIITNAELRILNENLTTSDIKKSDNINSVSTKHDFLFFHNKPGENLRNYNFEKLSFLLTKEFKEEFAKRANTFTKEAEHFVEVFTSNYCPQIILIMHHDDLHENYKKLFNYIDFLSKPSPELERRILEEKEKHKKKMEGMKRKIRTPKV